MFKTPWINHADVRLTFGQSNLLFNYDRPDFSQGMLHTHDKRSIHYLGKAPNFKDVEIKDKVFQTPIQKEYLDLYFLILNIPESDLFFNPDSTISYRYKLLLGLEVKEKLFISEGGEVSKYGLNNDENNINSFPLQYALGFMDWKRSNRDRIGALYLQQDYIGISDIKIKLEDKLVNKSEDKNNFEKLSRTTDQ